MQRLGELHAAQLPGEPQLTAFPVHCAEQTLLTQTDGELQAEQVPPWPQEVALLPHAAETTIVPRMLIWQ